MKFYASLLALITLATTQIHAGEPARITAEPALPPAKYIAHEWGTFTSVQGSDGILLDWRPLAVSDLPSFVYDRNKPGIETQTPGYFAKYRVNARQRMETPVIYFYTDQEAIIDAAVAFPEGLLTEWYPRVRDFRPMLTPAGKTPELKGGLLNWGSIRLIPAKNNDALLGKLLKESAPSHYYPARETDAAFVRHCVNTLNTKTPYEYEKFLFYRGLGNFAAPLTTVSKSNGELSLTNTSSDELRSLFLVEVKDGQGRFEMLGSLAGRATLNAALQSSTNPEPLSVFTAKLGQAMEAALVKEGLYAKEAAAMVNTWKDAWFEESGVRVLYMLPTSWTDKTLPLTLSPKPTELVRVMVGRSEVLTREMETQVQSIIAQLGADSFQDREQASQSLRKFGRFTEPALQRTLNTTQDPEIKLRTQKLLSDLRTPALR